MIMTQALMMMMMMRVMTLTIDGDDEERNNYSNERTPSQHQLEMNTMWAMKISRPTTKTTHGLNGH